MPDQLTPLLPLAAFGIAAVLYFALAEFNRRMAERDDNDDDDQESL